MPLLYWVLGLFIPLHPDAAISVWYIPELHAPSCTSSPAIVYNLIFRKCTQPTTRSAYDSSITFRQPSSTHPHWHWFPEPKRLLHSHPFECMFQGGNSPMHILEVLMCNILKKSRTTKAQYLVQQRSTWHRATSSVLSFSPFGVGLIFPRAKVESQP